MEESKRWEKEIKGKRGDRLKKYIGCTRKVSTLDELEGIRFLKEKKKEKKS